MQASGVPFSFAFCIEFPRLWHPTGKNVPAPARVSPSAQFALDCRLLFTAFSWELGSSSSDLAGLLNEMLSLHKRLKKHGVSFGAGLPGPPAEEARVSTEAVASISVGLQDRTDLGASRSLLFMDGWVFPPTSGYTTLKAFLRTTSHLNYVTVRCNYCWTVWKAEHR